MTFDCFEDNVFVIDLLFGCMHVVHILLKLKSLSLKDGVYLHILEICTKQMVTFFYQRGTFDFIS